MRGERVSRYDIAKSPMKKTKTLMPNNYHVNNGFQHHGYIDSDSDTDEEIMEEGGSNNCKNMVMSPIKSYNKRR